MAARPKPRAISQDARDLMGDAIAANGSAWEPLAQRVREGFQNFWLEPALRAIDRAMDEGRPDPDPK